jgi:membrane protein required for colicin V production
MNFIDIIIIIPVIWFIYKGYKKGFIIELASLAALILGVYAAIYYSGNIIYFLDDLFDIEKKYINIIAFALTFIVVVIVVMFIGKILEKIIKIVMLGFVNRIIGALFGIVKILIILSFLIFLIELIDDKQKFITEEKKDNSMLYYPVASIAPTIISFFQAKQDDFPDINLS